MSNFGDPRFVIRSIVFHPTWISESCNANEELFTLVERAFCLERPCLTHHWSLPKNNLRIRCFHFDMSLGHPLLSSDFFRIHCVTSAQFLPICHCVAKQEDTLNTNWVRQGVVLYSLLLNLCLCFYLKPIPFQVHAWVCMSIEHIYMRPSRLKRYIE